ncbi:MAG: GAP family protein, partial [Actinomycetes bacterium]
TTTSELFSAILVPALIIAVNPVPIIASVTLLSTPHGKRNALYFIATVVILMLAIGSAVIFIVGQSGSSSTSSGGSAVTLALGLIFLAVAVQQWRTKPEQGKDPGWMKALDKAGLIAGVVLGVSLTNYALLTSGVEKIVKSGLSSSVQTTALVVFTLIATSTIILPLIVFLVRPVWARKVLGGFRDWLMKHNRVILIVVFGAMGLLFTIQGVTALLK